MTDWVFPATVHAQPSAILPVLHQSNYPCALLRRCLHFLARLEVRHVLLIDSDEGAISRIATVPRRAVSHAERTKPTQFHAVAACHRRNDFPENDVDDLQRRAKKGAGSGLKCAVQVRI